MAGGSYQGADLLTWQPLPPGTRAYRAPEAIRAVLPPIQVEKLPYAPGPADDVFALGVTAYRLVTGKYPPTADPLDEGVHVWREDGPGPQPARELNPRCGPELSGLISRMLSLRPEARGSAREVAEALEQAAKKAGPEADAPLFDRVQPEARGYASELAEALAPAGKKADVLLFDRDAAPERMAPRALGGNWQPWLVAAVVVGPVVLGAAWLLSRPGGEDAAQEQATQQEEARDAGTAALGEAVLTMPVALSHAPTASSPIALDMPSKPFRGQSRPDANGRCLRRHHVAINGGCWIETKEDPKNCGRDLYLYKGACYEPAFPPPLPATSDPTESRDGG